MRGAEKDTQLCEKMRGKKMVCSSNTGCGSGSVDHTGGEEVRASLCGA